MNAGVRPHWVINASDGYRLLTAATKAFALNSEVVSFKCNGGLQQNPLLPDEPNCHCSCLTSKSTTPPWGI